ncbi:hypothetical protein DFJ73DRAFT_430548 [Zopfochytrium polystomum]|nr:hypothetical protein DFJ73DRAFT_430548 [Zopfochytrium polystomum]
MRRATVFDGQCSSLHRCDSHDNTLLRIWVRQIKRERCFRNATDNAALLRRFWAVFFNVYHNHRDRDQNPVASTAVNHDSCYLRSPDIVPWRCLQLKSATGNECNARGLHKHFDGSSCKRCLKDSGDNPVPSTNLWSPDIVPWRCLQLKGATGHEWDTRRLHQYCDGSSRQRCLDYSGNYPVPSVVWHSLLVQYGWHHCAEHCISASSFCGRDAYRAVHTNRDDSCQRRAATDRDARIFDADTYRVLHHEYDCAGSDKPRHSNPYSLWRSSATDRGGVVPVLDIDRRPHSDVGADPWVCVVLHRASRSYKNNHAYHHGPHTGRCTERNFYQRALQWYGQLTRWFIVHWDPVWHWSRFYSPSLSRCLFDCLVPRSKPHPVAILNCVAVNFSFFA